eukprot:m51a1_g4713 putative alpha-galactosidase alpha-n-acetylgalactosaminidase (575) ;mRNA; r:295358-298244
MGGGRAALWLLACAGAAAALDNGVARLPPMGWLSWERFWCDVDCAHAGGAGHARACLSEGLVLEMADALADEGYAALGYRYVNVDDCWGAVERGSDGSLAADPWRFPSGLKARCCPPAPGGALADYVHSRGLLFGTYSDIGTKTCEGYPGNDGHFDQDAATLASWGVDMLKVDGCYADRTAYGTTYPEFGRALNRTGRPMLYECSWPFYERNPDYARVARHCNMWRPAQDIWDDWSRVQAIIEWFAAKQDVLIPTHGPGHWHDPDMLVIGNYGLSYEQSKLQMMIWSVLAAPLLVSADLRTIAPELKAVLQNAEVIAVDQDPLGIMGRHWQTGAKGFHWWRKPLADGTVALVVANLDAFGGARTLTTRLEALGMASGRVRDLWAHRDLGLKVGAFSVTILPMTGHMFRVADHSAPVLCELGARALAGHRVSVAAAQDAYAQNQRWVLSQEDGTIRLEAERGLCLAVSSEAGPSGRGMALELTECQTPPSSAQRMTLDPATGQLTNAVSSECVAAPLKVLLVPLYNVTGVNTRRCKDERSETWVAQDGYIRLRSNPDAVLTACNTGALLIPPAEP